MREELFDQTYDVNISCFTFIFWFCFVLGQWWIKTTTERIRWDQETDRRGRRQGDTGHQEQIWEATERWKGSKYEIERRDWHHEEKGRVTQRNGGEMMVGGVGDTGWGCWWMGTGSYWVLWINIREAGLEFHQGHRGYYLPFWGFGLQVNAQVWTIDSL